MSKVLKFGGTSMDKLDQVASIVVKQAKEESVRTYVCVSAFSGVTDKLKQIADQASDDLSRAFNDLKKLHYSKIEEGISLPDDKEFVQQQFSDYFDGNRDRILFHVQNIIDTGHNEHDFDQVIGFGEQISAYVLSCLISHRINTRELVGQFIDLSQIVPENFEIADKVYLAALKANIFAKLNSNQEPNDLSIITGFFGKVPGGILYSIDRGYTDFTAAFLASIVRASKLVIYKEVDGIFSADPRIVGKGARFIKRLTFTETAKMTSTGMKALNYSAVEPAMASGIPIEIKNTFKPDNEGTIIGHQRENDPGVEIQSIVSKGGVAILRFGGFDGYMAEALDGILLKVIKKHRLRRYFSTQDEAGCSWVVDKDNGKISKIMDELREYDNAEVKLTNNCAIVGAVGQEMRGKPGIFAKATSCISSLGANIHMVAQGGAELMFAYVIDETALNDAVNNLHDKFFSKLS